MPSQQLLHLFPSFAYLEKAAASNIKVKDAAVNAGGGGGSIKIRFGGFCLASSSSSSSGPSSSSASSSIPSSISTSKDEANSSSSNENTPTPVKKLSTRKSIGQSILNSALRRTIAPFTGSSAENKKLFAERTQLFYAKALKKAMVRVVLLSAYSRQSSSSTSSSTAASNDIGTKEINVEALLSSNESIYPHVVDVSTDSEDGLFNGELTVSIKELERLLDGGEDDLKALKKLSLQDNHLDASDDGELPPPTTELMLKIFAFVPEDIENVFGSISIPLIIPPSPTTNIINKKGNSKRALSIISDVDDTIKLSSVYKGVMPALHTALLQPLQEVPGMGESYRTIFSEEGPSTAFHYVSAGPYQLLPMLQDFLGKFQFPIGSLILRRARVEKSGEYKKRVILDILKTFPERDFILIGDSGELDIETYEGIRQESLSDEEIFGKIQMIFIRHVDPAGKGQDSKELLLRAGGKYKEEEREGVTKEPSAIAEPSITKLDSNGYLNEGETTSDGERGEISVVAMPEKMRKPWFFQSSASSLNRDLDEEDMFEEEQQRGVYGSGGSLGKQQSGGGGGKKKRRGSFVEDLEHWTLFSDPRELVDKIRLLRR